MKKTEFFDYDKYLSSKPAKNEATPLKEDENKAADIEITDKGKANGKNGHVSKTNRKRTEKSDPVESIRKAFDDALDEDVAEIAEFSVTKNIDDEPAIKKPGFKRNLYFIIGIAVSFMSLIGFISTVAFCAGFITNIADNTKQKEEFADIIYPIVIVDPASFEEAPQLSSDTVIAAAIWDIILHEDISKYPEEFGTMTIPQLDVELHATSLLGPGLTFEHKTLGDASLSFYYDEETKSYNVPTSPKFFPYSPLVENINRDGDTYKLKVGYVSPSPAWLMDKKSKVEPDKYMEYVLKKNGNSYTLTAINEIEDSSNVNNGL